MGEQSAKSLRGDKMEDVIFSGSDARKPTAAAEVRLRFSGVVKQVMAAVGGEPSGGGAGFGQTDEPDLVSGFKPTGDDVHTKGNGNSAPAQFVAGWTAQPP